MRMRISGSSGLHDSTLKVLLFLLLVPAGQASLAAQEKPFPFDLGSESWFLAPAGLGLTALGLRLTGGEDPITLQEVRMLSSGGVNPFDRFATRNWSPDWGHRSDAARGAAYGVALLVVGGEMFRAASDGRFGDALRLGGMLGEVSLLTTGATYVTKALAGRRRPYLYNPSLTPEKRLELSASKGGTPTESFFSGHASSTFAAAVFASTVFTEINGRSVRSDLVWAGTLSLATLTAMARVKAGMHFPSDVVVGALVGGGIGYLVPQFHRKDEKGLFYSGIGGLEFGYTFRF